MRILNTSVYVLYYDSIEYTSQPCMREREQDVIGRQVISKSLFLFFPQNV